MILLLLFVYGEKNKKEKSGKFGFLKFHKKNKKKKSQTPFLTPSKTQPLMATPTPTHKIINNIKTTGKNNSKTIPKKSDLKLIIFCCSLIGSALIIITTILLFINFKSK